MSTRRGEDDEDHPEYYGETGLPWLEASRDARPWLSGEYASATDDYNLHETSVLRDSSID